MADRPRSSPTAPARRSLGMAPRWRSPTAGRGSSSAIYRVAPIGGPLARAQFSAPVAWTPDGRGVAYASDGNIWVQPLGGGAPRQLTRFTDRRPIQCFAWSRDGKRLAMTRSTQTNDIVLFKGTQAP